MSFTALLSEQNVQSLLRFTLQHPTKATAAGAALVYLLARFRLLPRQLLRALFLWNMFLCALVANVGCIVVNCLRRLGVSKTTADRWCLTLTTALFRVHRWMCPHVQVRFVEGSMPWTDMARTQAMLCVNHPSFFDVFLYIWVVPFHALANTKTFFKGQLANWPLAGRLFTSSGLFPVYFRANSGPDFSVEKDKQQLVADEATEFIRNGGCLSLCPEGAVNHGDPRVLATFRHGSFTMFFEQRVPEVYYMVTCGNEHVWPHDMFLGGFPGSVLVKVGKVVMDYSDPEMDAKKMSVVVREAMQKELDLLYAMKDEAQTH